MRMDLVPSSDNSFVQIEVLRRNIPDIEHVLLVLTIGASESASVFDECELKGGRDQWVFGRASLNSTERFERAVQTRNASSKVQKTLFGGGDHDALVVRG